MKGLQTKIDKDTLFALSYIEHMGNATAAAREAFKIKSDAYAAKKGSEMVRKSKVQDLISEYMESRRKMFKEFVDQGPFYLTVIAQRLINIIQDEDTSVEDVLKTSEMLARLAGVELSKEGAIARIQAEAKQSAPEQPLRPAESGIRKTIFMLSPPPMPPGGKPTPALEQQWRDMGWKPHQEEG